MLPRREKTDRQKHGTLTHRNSKNHSDVFEDVLNERSLPITSVRTDNTEQKWGHYCLNVIVTAWGVVIGLAAKSVEHSF